MMQDDPKDVGIDVGFKERRTLRRMQPDMRDAATHAGHHLACRLPKCRRAKRCTGCHPVEEIATTHFKKFPPCVYDDATQASLLKGWEMLRDFQDRQWLAAGYTPEEADRLAEDYDEALEDSEVWPLPPPPPPAGASQTGGRSPRRRGG